MNSQYKIEVDELKFNSAHFINFDDYREYLHGHNYTLKVKICAKELVQQKVAKFKEIQKYFQNLIVGFKGKLLIPKFCQSLSLVELNEKMIKIQ